MVLNGITLPRSVLVVVGVAVLVVAGCCCRLPTSVRSERRENVIRYHGTQQTGACVERRYRTTVRHHRAGSGGSTGVNGIVEVARLLLRHVVHDVVHLGSQISYPSPVVQHNRNDDTGE
uniref:Putative secreted peptide n=1 Tax=Anopheles braziliensis TaxID=58242 RepID=A0A2M3ZMR8_9DIPT